GRVDLSGLCEVAQPVLIVDQFADLSRDLLVIHGHSFSQPSLIFPPDPCRMADETPTEPVRPAATPPPTEPAPAAAPAPVAPPPPPPGPGAPPGYLPGPPWGPGP